MLSCKHWYSILNDFEIKDVRILWKRAALSKFPDARSSYVLDLDSRGNYVDLDRLNTLRKNQKNEGGSGRENKYGNQGENFEEEKGEEPYGTMLLLDQSVNHSGFSSILFTWKGYLIERFGWLKRDPVFLLPFRNPTTCFYHNKHRSKFERLKRSLPPKECLYILYALDFDLIPPFNRRYIIRYKLGRAIPADHDHQAKGKADPDARIFTRAFALISWFPEDSKTKEKMVYASFLGETNQNLAKRVQATELEDLNFDEVLEAMTTRWF